MGAPASEQGQRRALNMVLVGTWLFSGSIVGLVALGTLEVGTWFRAVLGPVTPIGGVLMVGLGLASLQKSDRFTIGWAGHCSTTASARFGPRCRGTK